MLEEKKVNQSTVNMRIHLYSLIMISLFTFVCAFDSSEGRSDFIKFLLAILSKHHAFTLVIALSSTHDPFNNTEALQLTQILSKQNVFSMMVKINELEEGVKHNKNEVVQPMYVVILETSDDFESFINFTKINKMNQYFWLVIFKSNSQTLMDICESPQKNYFNLVYDVWMLVVCKFLDSRRVIPIKEWYSLHTNETAIVDYAVWNTSRLKRSGDRGFWNRRKSLKGIPLRVTSVKRDKTTDRYDKPQGYLAELLTIVAHSAGFTIDNQTPEEFYGVYNSTTKRWNGVIAKLVNKETDIGLGEFTVTKKRLKFIDFSEPIVISPAKFYVKKPNHRILDWSMYHKAFGRTNLYALLSIILIVPPLISYIILCKRKINNTRKIYNSYLKIIRDCYFDVLGIICKIPLTSSSDFSSLRTVSILLFILSYAIVTVYSGFLTSYLTIFKFHLPFNSLDEFKQDGTYKMAIIKETSFADFFRNPRSKLRNFLLKNEDLPSYIATGIEMVCTERVILFMDEYSVISNQSNPACELVAFDRGQVISMGLAFTKDSPYVKYFNYFFQRMRSRGLLRFIRKRYERSIKPLESNYEPVTLYSTLPLFVILAVGVLLSFIILICENVYFYKSLRRHEFAKSRTNYWRPLIRPGNNPLE